MGIQYFKESLLNQKIEELDLSNEFKTLTSKYGYKTLGEILKLDNVENVLKHPGFGRRIFFEFTHIICENGLGFYFDKPQ